MFAWKCIAVLSLFDFFFLAKIWLLLNEENLQELLEDELSYATEMHNTWNTHLYMQLYTKCCITMKSKNVFSYKIFQNYRWMFFTFP